MIQEQSDSVAQTAGSTDTVNELQLEGCRVLYAEDGFDNQQLVIRFLKKEGAVISVVDNGQLALDEAQRALDAGEPYDVILMDMQMPVMDGYTAVQTLRKQGYQGPIIALTAHAMTYDREKCLDTGCDDFLTKPFNRKKLIASIRQCTGRDEVA